MRTVASFLLGFVALVVVAVAVPGMWVERNVVDESGYVALAGPLGEDPAFRAALADTVADGVITGAGLEGPAARVASPVVRRVAEGMTDMTGFDRAWTESNTLSHRLNVTDIPPAELDGRLGVDLTPMVALVTDAANQRLGTDLSPPGDLVVAIGTPDDRALLDRLRTLAPWSWGLLGIAIIAAAVAVLAARRRGTALLALGAGLVVVAALEMAVLVLGGDRAVDRLATETVFSRALVEQLHDVIVASYGVWMLVLGGVGVVVAAAGLAARVRT